MSAAIPVEQIKTITMSIYRYDPTVDKKPYMQDIVVEIPTDKDIMVLDACILLRTKNRLYLIEDLAEKESVDRMV